MVVLVLMVVVVCAAVSDHYDRNCGLEWCDLHIREVSGIVHRGEHGMISSTQYAGMVKGITLVHALQDLLKKHPSVVQKGKASAQ